MVLPGRPVFAEDPGPQTLLSCYHLALEQSEEIAINRERIKEAEGFFLQSLSTVLPRASYAYSTEWQDEGGTSSGETQEGKFVLSQPLFQGFKEFAAIAGGRYLKQERGHLLNYARLLLFRDVADAFYVYLSFQQDMDVLGGIHQILSERLEELKKREALGRSRVSDMVSVEAQLRRLEAEMEDIRSQKDVAGQLLEFLTGKNISVLIDDMPIEHELQDVGVYVQQSQERPDVLAQRDVARQAEAAAKAARAGYFPFVSLDGNQYTRREGASENVAWDVMLSVDVPLFQGGETTGQVVSARAVNHEEELRYSQFRRRAEQDVKNAHTRFLSALRRSDALARAVEASQKNYDLQVQDFQINLVNNLDVLDALEELQDTRRDYITVQNEVKQLYWRFKTSIGELPSTDD